MEYGKFASAEELLKGYMELERSFTQKCQQLAAVEKKQSSAAQQGSDGISAEASPSIAETAQSTTVDSADTVPQNGGDAQPVLDGSAPVSNVPTEEELQQYLLNNPEIVQKILQQNQTEQVPAVMSGGGNVSLALPSRPKTIKEASIMAKEMFGSH